MTTERKARIMEWSVAFAEFDWEGQPGVGEEETGGSQAAGCVGGKVSPW